MSKECEKVTNGDSALFLNLYVPTMRNLQLSLCLGMHVLLLAPPLYAQDAEIDALEKVQIEQPSNPEEAGLRPFHCPGDDFMLFEEMKEAGLVGYGETWDFFTCSQEGVDVFPTDATRIWKKLRPRLANPRGFRWTDRTAEEEVEFYSTVLPGVAFGSLLLIVLAAWGLAMIQTRKAHLVVNVACPHCKESVPVNIKGKHNQGMFCPSCGKSSMIVSPGRGGEKVTQVRHFQ